MVVLQLSPPQDGGEHSVSQHPVRHGGHHASIEPPWMGGNTSSVSRRRITAIPWLQLSPPGWGGNTPLLLGPGVADQLASIEPPWMGTLKEVEVVEDWLLWLQLSPPWMGGNTVGGGWLRGCR